MSHYIHHVPGRLRVKTVQLKRNEAKAAEVCKLLAATEGVLNCEVKTVTGSILISYDAEAVQADKLMALLKDHGYVAEAAAIDKPNLNGRASRAVSAAGENVGKVIFGFVVEKALERSAAALIGAIL